MADEVKKEEIKPVAKRTRKKVIKKVIVGIDNTPEDVLKFVDEGHKLYFDDGDNFLELDEEVLKKLPTEARQRYRLAKSIASGEDVIGAATAGTLGYDPTEYNVRAGSATENTMVYGKNPDREYTWGRPDKHNKKLAEGWVVDVDPNVKTRFDESGTQKTLGGTNKREATLYSRSKAKGNEFRAKRKELRNARLMKSQNTTKEMAIKMGIKVSD